MIIKSIGDGKSTPTASNSIQYYLAMGSSNIIC